MYEVHHQSRLDGAWFLETRRQQLCKESGAAFSLRAYMAVWPNLDCVCDLITFSHRGLRDPAKPRFFLASHHSTYHEVKTNTPQNYGSQDRNPSRLAGFLDRRRTAFFTVSLRATVALQRSARVFVLLRPVPGPHA